jgi:hypothetical protein
MTASFHIPSNCSVILPCSSFSSTHQGCTNLAKKKSGNYVRILGARRLTCRKFRTEKPRNITCHRTKCCRRQHPRTEPRISDKQSNLFIVSRDLRVLKAVNYVNSGFSLTFQESNVRTSYRETAGFSETFVNVNQITMQNRILFHLLVFCRQRLTYGVTRR